MKDNKEKNKQKRKIKNIVRKIKEIVSGALVGDLKPSHCLEKNYEEPDYSLTFHSTVVIGSAFISSLEVHFL